MSKPTDCELLERWRVAGMILSRLDPELLRLALTVAEVAITQTPEDQGEIKEVDFHA